MILIIRNIVPPGPRDAALISPPPHPTTPQSKLSNLKSALRCWNASGRPITPKAARRERAGICAACPHWRPGGNLGLGECTAPGCGCTRAKWWIATEACPLRKWGPTA